MAITKAVLPISQHIHRDIAASTQSTEDEINRLVTELNAQVAFSDNPAFTGDLTTTGSAAIDGTLTAGSVASTTGSFTSVSGTTATFSSVTATTLSFTSVAGTNLTVTGTPHFANTTDLVSGGNTDVRILFSSNTDFGIYAGIDPPTINAAQGSLYLRTDGAGTDDRLYISLGGTWTGIITLA
jgi:hypothetical protein